MHAKRSIKNLIRIKGTKKFNTLIILIWYTVALARNKALKRNSFIYLFSANWTEHSITDVLSERSINVCKGYTLYIEYGKHK